MRRALQWTVALTAVTLAAGLVSALALLLGGSLTPLAPIGLAVCLVTAAVGLDLAARMLAGAEGRLEDLAEACEAARREAHTDALTGLWNRRHFDDRLTEAIIGALRYGDPFSVALFDLDDFKQVNDREGHLVGDRVLQHVGALLRAGTRDLDIVCRWGGEEFAVLLPRTRADDAARVAERIVGRLRTTGVDVGARMLPLTASAGISAFPTDGIDGPSVLDAADSALLRAKALGKDRVERASSCVGATLLVDLTDRATAPADQPRTRA